MDTNTKIYVAGHRGLVGSALLRRLDAKGYSNIMFRTHSELDLEDSLQVRDLFAVDFKTFAIVGSGPPIPLDPIVNLLPDKPGTRILDRIVGVFLKMNARVKGPECFSTTTANNQAFFKTPWNWILILKYAPGEAG